MYDAAGGLHGFARVTVSCCCSLAPALRLQIAGNRSLQGVRKGLRYTIAADFDVTCMMRLGWCPTRQCGDMLLNSVLLLLTGACSANANHC